MSSPSPSPSPYLPPPSPYNDGGGVAPPRPVIALEPSTKKDRSRAKKIIRRVQSVFRAFPIITPMCKMPVSINMTRDGNYIHGGSRVTGTLFGNRKARVNLSIQENSNKIPILVLELAIPTGKLLQDMGLGLVRIALECEKKPAEKVKIVDEPIWTLYCNGRKSGYGVRREPTEEDLTVMQTLHAVSMGAGVIPCDASEPDGDLTYMRVQFERVIGSKDSETYYMMTPDGNNGPELSIFFVRV